MKAGERWRRAEERKLEPGKLGDSRGKSREVVKGEEKRQRNPGPGKAVLDKFLEVKLNKVLPSFIWFPFPWHCI